jgi:hypothetical protein
MAQLRAGGLTTALVLFLLVLLALLGDALLPGHTLFSNDGPLGQLMSDNHRMPQRFLGCWSDLNSIGFNGGSASPSITFGLLWLLGPILFSKSYAIISLLILGLGAWAFFHQLKLSAPACILGGFAAILNSTYFSVACWGVGAHDITAGMTFFALAALADTSAPRVWLRVVLAGLALGMAVTEGADVGAIYSVYVAAFLIYQIWTTSGSPVRRTAGGLGRLLLVVLCAGFMAAQAIHGLIGADIVGIKGAQQDEQTKAQRWDWATQWSMPRLETLNLVIPGIFGYRMDDLNERAYWGNMGRSPAWQKYLDNNRQGPRPKGFIRYTGGGNYAGALVVMLALWAAADSFRRRKSAFDLTERKWVWFWFAIAVVSLLLALGRYAPFYKYVYELPYFSTIRNPTKFIYPFSLALVTLCAFGVHGLYRHYMQSANPGATPRWPGFGGWWARAAKFERIWVWISGVLGLGILIGWWQYAAYRPQLIQHLQSVDITNSAEAIADYSISCVGWFAAVFFLGAGLMVLIFSGVFAGRRAVVGTICLGVLLVGEMGLANHPWVHIWNYQEKYSSNAILDILRDKPYEHRVAVAPIEQAHDFSPCFKLYKLEWVQHEFPYNNIQAFETVEMPRVPLDFAAWTATLNNTNFPGTWFHLTRAWALTDVGYLVAPPGLADYLNRQTFFAAPPLKLVTNFKLEAKPGITFTRRPDQVTAVPDSNGPYGLYQFTAAVGRARLYSHWEVETNGTNALNRLMSVQFDPLQNVIVDDNVAPSPTNATDLAAGSVAITSYAPKDIVLKADVTSPSILLLSDHYEPDWKVLIDGRAGTVLKCDFLLRGVQLAPGAHQVEFKFEPSTGWLGISVTADVVAVVVMCLLTVRVKSERKRAVKAGVSPVTPPAPAPAPAASAAKPDSTKPNRRIDSRKKSSENRPAKR